MLSSIARLVFPHIRRLTSWSLLILLIGGVGAASGLGQLMRTFHSTFPEAERTFRVEALASDSHRSSTRADTAAIWAAAFGSPPLESGTAWLLEPIEEAPTVTGDLDYRLRGIVIEDGHGFALLDGGNGTEVVRAGGELSDGRKLVEVRNHSVLIEGQGGTRALLAFPEPVFADHQENPQVFSRDGRVGLTLQEIEVAETPLRRRMHQTTHSRPPPLSPNRFFSIAN